MSGLVTVNFNGSSFPVRFSYSWTIARLKREIAHSKRVDPKGIKIIFAGRELPDDQTLENCEVNHSVIHAVDKGPTLTVQASVISSGAMSLTHVELEDDDYQNGTDQRQDGQASFFYVFCKTCKKLAKGKLRCRCFLCKEGSFVLTQGPNCWDDVLKKQKMSGRCEAMNCPGNTAEFYFKCGEHHGNDEQAPLPMCKTNVRRIPCITCSSENAEVVLVFSCDNHHTICLECFSNYCITYLDSRRFVQTEDKGYTITCPGNSDSCQVAYIEEPHHFRLLGDNQYCRFQNFATEECILQTGGVLCPGRGCGQGIFPLEGQRRVVCQRGCGLEFCRDCLGSFHTGACEANGNFARLAAAGDLRSQFASERSNELSRWDLQSQECIRKTTKRCPNTKCNVPTEKNAGCNHMTCTRCHHEWCWVCRVPWNRQCQSSHWFAS